MIAFVTIGKKVYKKDIDRKKRLWYNIIVAEYF